jgi:polyisoprenyl-teichoic acid--peptidoglycan teichoic acid transferase
MAVLPCSSAERPSRRGFEAVGARLRADLSNPNAPDAERPRPLLAATLSFLWPGLGHAYATRWLWAAILGLPVVALALYVAIQVAGGADLFAVQMIDPAFAAGVIAWTVGLCAWRLFAIGTAFQLGSTAARAAVPARVGLAVLVVAVLAMHGYVGYVAVSFYQAGTAIFVPSPDASTPPIAAASASAAPTGAATSTAPGASATTAPTTAPPSSQAPSNRVTFLLTGVDSGHDREHALTDTLLVVSFDTVDKTAVMMSVPRDISEFDLYSGGTYHGKINSLMTAALNDPAHYPDGPMGTLTRQIGYIIGVPVDYYAQLNLDGFSKMINLVGGVDVDNPRAIDDPVYDWFDGTHGFKLSAGKHHLDGRIGLAYVRSRQGIGDNDFTRARRQQQVIAALRAKMTTASALQKLPDLLDVASKTIRTDFPADKIRDYLGLAKQIGDDQTQRYVLGPPYAKTPTVPGSTYILLLDKARIAKLSIKAFGADSAYNKSAP